MRKDVMKDQVRGTHRYIKWIIPWDESSMGSGCVNGYVLYVSVDVDTQERSTNLLQVRLEVNVVVVVVAVAASPIYSSC